MATPDSEVMAGNYNRFYLRLLPASELVTDGRRNIFFLPSLPWPLRFIESEPQETGKKRRLEEARRPLLICV